MFTSLKNKAEYNFEISSRTGSSPMNLAVLAEGKPELEIKRIWESRSKREGASKKVVLGIAAKY